VVLLVVRVVLVWVPASAAVLLSKRRVA